MSLAFVSRRGSFEAPWVAWALLRDNLVHHVEQGARSAGFEQFQRLGAALGGSPVKVKAAALNSYLASARAALVDRPLSALAVSEQTESVLSQRWPLPASDATHVVSDAAHIPWVPRDARTLGDVFGGFIDSLLELTAEAGAGDDLEVTDS